MLSTGLILFGIAVIICLISVVITIALHLVGKGELDRLFSAAACGAMVIIILLAFFQGLKIIDEFMIPGYDFGAISEKIRAFEVLK